MARKPNSKPVQMKPVLLQALEFCSCVSEKLGTPYETHISLRNNWAIAFNGIIAAGAPIDTDICMHPNCLQLIEALSKCEDTFSLTQLDTTRLSIKAGKFKAIVPSLDIGLMQYAQPDPIIVPITNKFKEAVEAVGVLADENGQHILVSSVLMNGPSVVSTNRKVIMEYWHGLDMPTNVPLTKQFVSALAKQKKNLIGFGISNNSATFHYEDGYWLKTQLCSDQWPDVSKILNVKGSLWSIDPNFFKALEAVAPFSEDGCIYFDTNLLRSHPTDSIGASHECNGIPKGAIYPAKQLALMKPYVKTIDYMANSNGVHTNTNAYCLIWEGDNARGIISGRERR